MLARADLKAQTARLRVLAKAVISTTCIKRVSFLPMTMDRQYHTEVLKLKAGDPGFDKVV